MAIVTAIDRPKSVPNRCVMDIFGGVFVCHVAFWIILSVKGFLSLD